MIMKCTDCDGTGSVGVLTCLNCGGTGSEPAGNGTVRTMDLVALRGGPAMYLTIDTDDAPHYYLVEVSEELLEKFQGEIQTYFGRPHDWPVCVHCGGQLAQARRMAPDRSFWVHAISDMDTHVPEPATR